MDDPPDLEARVSALEGRIEEVAADATAARHLASAGDRDLADLGIKVDANRAAIDALGLQLNGRLTDVERRLDGHDARFDRLESKVDDGFAEMRGKFDATAAGQQAIVDLLTTLIDDGPASST